MVKNRQILSAKSFFWKMYLAEKNVTDFFQILEIKKFLILKMNFFWIFYFLKKQ
jgi:hypothetical protein